MTWINMTKQPRNLNMLSFSDRSRMAGLNILLCKPSCLRSAELKWWTINSPTLLLHSLNSCISLWIINSKYCYLRGKRKKKIFIWQWHHYFVHGSDRTSEKKIEDYAVSSCRNFLFKGQIVWRKKWNPQNFFAFVRGFVWKDDFNLSISVFIHLEMTLCILEVSSWSVFQQRLCEAFDLVGDVVLPPLNYLPY